MRCEFCNTVFEPNFEYCPGCERKAEPILGKVLDEKEDAILEIDKSVMDKMRRKEQGQRW